jgi:hypothetical protein
MAAGVAVGPVPRASAGAGGMTEADAVIPPRLTIPTTTSPYRRRLVRIVPPHSLDLGIVMVHR